MPLNGSVSWVVSVPRADGQRTHGYHHAHSQKPSRPLHSDPYAANRYAPRHAARRRSNERHNGEMAELRLHVHGMDCADETALVRRALAPNPAIRAVEFDLINGNVEVTFDESATDPSATLTASRSHRTGRPHTAVAKVKRRHHGQDTRATSTIRPTVVRRCRRPSAARCSCLAGSSKAPGLDHWLDVFVHHTHDRSSIGPLCPVSVRRPVADVATRAGIGSSSPPRHARAGVPHGHRRRPDWRVVRRSRRRVPVCAGASHGGLEHRACSPRNQRRSLVAGRH